MPGKIDDVSASVNKQIKTLEVSYFFIKVIHHTYFSKQDQLVTGYDLLQLFKEEADSIRKEVDVMMNVLIEKTEVV